MSSRILKWSVPIDDHDHEIGSGPVVHVDQQHNARMVQVWTLESDRPAAIGQPPPKRARVVGTGHEFDGWAWTHAGTVVDRTHNLVWHVLVGPGQTGGTGR